MVVPQSLHATFQPKQQEWLLNLSELLSLLRERPGSTVSPDAIADSASTRPERGPHPAWDIQEDRRTNPAPVAGFAFQAQRSGDQRRRHELATAR